MKRISLFLIICLCLILTGCGNNKEKEVGTLSNFEDSTNRNGFITMDNIIEYQDADYITDAYLATKDETKLEMIIYREEQNAKDAQDNQISKFLNLKSSNANINKDKGKNYYKYTMISNGYYMVSSRIDNTLIFTKCKLTEKDSIENILNEMGY